MVTGLAVDLDTRLFVVVDLHQLAFLVYELPDRIPTQWSPQTRRAFWTHRPTGELTGSSVVADTITPTSPLLQLLLVPAIGFPAHANPLAPPAAMTHFL